MRQSYSNRVTRVVVQVLRVHLANTIHVFAKAFVPGAGHFYVNCSELVSIEYPIEKELSAVLPIGHCLHR